MLLCLALLAARAAWMLLCLAGLLLLCQARLIPASALLQC